jgi:predicted ATPase
MGLELYSREEELASLHAFIGDARGGLPALVLEGEAGIGKSALWLAAVELARTRACVSCRRDRPSSSAASHT